MGLGLDRTGRGLGYRDASAPVALPDRGFRRFWAASTVSAAGTALTSVAVPIIAVQHLAATPAQMGVLFATATGASLLMRLPAATWADRSRDLLVVASRAQLLSGALIAVLPALWALSLLDYVALLGVVAAVALSGAVHEAFAAPAVPQLVDASRLGSAYGRFTASRSAAEVAGPSVGGLLLQLLPAPLLLLLDSISFFVAGLLTSSARAVARPAPLVDAGAPRGDLFAVVREPFLRRYIALMGLASLANGAVSALLVLFMVRELGLPALAVGIVLGVGAAGGILAGLLVGASHARLGIDRTAILGSSLLVASFVGLPLAQQGWSGLAACLLYELAGSFGAGLLVITVISEIPGRIARTAIARGMAITNLVPEIAATAGALAGGALATMTSVRLTLWSSLVFAALTIAIAVFMTRGRTRRPESAG